MPTEYTLDTSGFGQTQDGGATPVSAANVTVENVNVSPSGEIPVGDQVTVGVEVYNDAGWINPIDADYCFDSGSAYALTVEAEVNGSSADTDSKCIRGKTTGVAQLSFTAPGPGSHELSVSVAGKNSGSVTDTHTVSFTTIDPDAGNGGDDGDCTPPSGGCPNGEVFSYNECACVSEGDAGFFDQLSPAQQYMVLGGGALGVYAFLSR